MSIMVKAVAEIETHLIRLQRIVPALQQLPKRRLGPPPHILINRLKNLNRTTQRTRLDHTDKSTIQTDSSLEKARMARDAFRAFEAGHGVDGFERVERCMRTLASTCQGLQTQSRAGEATSPGPTLSMTGLPTDAQESEIVTN